MAGSIDTWTRGGRGDDGAASGVRIAACGVRMAVRKTDSDVVPRVRFGS